MSPTTEIRGKGRLYLGAEDLAILRTARAGSVLERPGWAFLSLGDALFFAGLLDGWARVNPSDVRSLHALMLAGDLRLMKVAR